jgi:pimeloyl-ACP methyl ester carboxylesterase
MQRRAFLLQSLGALSAGALCGPAPVRAKAAADPAVALANAQARGPQRYRQGWFGRGDTRLHYVEVGSGPLVILYHGFPSFWYCWFDQMEALKARYRVVAVDGLGANLSAKPEALESYRVPALAAQLDALARHLNGKRRFTLAGHDWGAALAFAFAQAYPARLRGVAGFSAPPFNQFLDLVRYDAAQQARSAYMQRFRALTLADIRARDVPSAIFAQAYGALIASGALSEAEAELFRKALADPAAIHGGMNWYRANIPPFAEISDSDYWPARGTNLTVPALLVWGNDDQTFTPSFLNLFEALEPRPQLVRIDGMNHWTTMESGTEATDALTAFVDRVNR